MNEPQILAHLPPVKLVIGLMSGTSLDGVDAALVDFSQGGPQLRASAYLPYSAELRSDILRLHNNLPDELHQSLLLANRLAQNYASAVQQLLGLAGVAPGAVAAIGCHGQTLRHQPARAYSLQLNNPALLAELTGITVVADFRSRDIAAGGQGAPLVPAFHEAVFRDAAAHRVILNLGGIANLTDLAPGATTLGFDCGPGNMLLDAWSSRHLDKPYDENGRWAASGRVLPELLGRLLAHPFFEQRPPKSCGREQFNLAWLENCLVGGEAAADVQASLMELTAVGVQQGLAQARGGPAEIYVCGGGARNTALMGRLRALLPGTRVATTEALGLAPDRVEATAFAWLAQRTLAGLPGNLPEVTGARGRRVLGAIYPA